MCVCVSERFASKGKLHSAGYAVRLCVCALVNSDTNGVGNVWVES